MCMLSPFRAIPSRLLPLRNANISDVHFKKCQGCHRDALCCLRVTSRANVRKSCLPAYVARRRWKINARRAMQLTRMGLRHELTRFRFLWNCTVSQPILDSSSRSKAIFCNMLFFLFWKFYSSFFVQREREKELFWNTCVYLVYKTYHEKQASVILQIM